MTAEVLPPNVLEMQENAGHRPNTAPDASCENGQGEVSMTVFVRTYMMSILQPFAANVEELHKVVMGLSTDLLATTETSEKQGISLAEHAAFLASLRSDLNLTTEQTNSNQSLLEVTREENKALYDDHEASKVRLGDVDRRLITAQGSIEELQAGLKDTRCKLSKLREKQAEMERSIAKDVNPSIDRVAAELAALDSSHNQTKQALSETKLGSETSTRDLNELTCRFNDSSGRTDSALEHITNRFQTLDDRMAEAYRHLHEKDGLDDTHNKQLEEMRSHMLAGDGAHKENQERLNRYDRVMTDHDVRATQFESNIKELLTFKNHLSGGRDLNKAVDILTEGHTKNLEDITSLKELTGNHTENLRQFGESFALFDESRTNLSERMKRAEKTIGLEAYRKEETFDGVKKSVASQFTEEQLAAFREIFNQFDTDGGGAITTVELGDVMRQLGEEPSQEMLASMVDEVDVDGSGEIEFDEFCTLMAKSMGKDGKVDTSKGAQSAIDNMSLMAKQKQALETINKHTTEIRQNLQEIQALKKLPTVVRIEALESRTSSMTDEMWKLSQGLDLTHEYWKGLSRGLRETKRSVHTEGQVLPSAEKLRTTLPLISKRPGTSGNMTGGSMTARI